MVLNLQDAFGFPFFAKSLLLRGFALRAIALSTVEAIVWVSNFAMRFLRIDITHGCRVALAVIGSGNGVQVLRVYTCPIPACVIDNKSVGDRTVRQVQRHAMCFSVGAAESENAVPVLIKMTVPDHAVSDAGPFGVEPFNFLRACVAHVCSLLKARTTYTVCIIKDCP